VKTALLDANVLLALAWPNHQHHIRARAWFSDHADFGWATCAFTQLAFVRLSSNPAFTKEAVSPQDAAALLREFTALETHRFWESPAADDRAIYARVGGHQQVNDAWLVEVARKNSGRLVTFDKPLAAFANAQAPVEVIPA
jgi:toxin-antitoxin system PIN domain toxin